MNETGHAKNVEAWATLHSRCVGFGAPYDPALTLIGVIPMGNKLTACNVAMSDVNTMVGEEKIRINEREDAFKGIRQLASRIVDSLAAQGAPASVVEDAKSFQRKINGTRAKTLPQDGGGPPDPDAPKTISAAQTSYVQTVNHLEGLVDLADSSGIYAPNEADLTIVALRLRIQELRDANAAVIEAHTNTSNARLARNVELYDPDAGVCRLAGLVKKYVKSAFGPSSPQYKQISSLVFRKYKI